MAQEYKIRTMVELADEDARIFHYVKAAMGIRSHSKVTRRCYRLAAALLLGREQGKSYCPVGKSGRRGEPLRLPGGPDSTEIGPILERIEAREQKRQEAAMRRKGRRRSERELAIASLTVAELERELAARRSGEVDRVVDLAARVNRGAE